MKRFLTMVLGFVGALGVVCADNGCIPLLEEGKEWGYVDYFDVNHPYRSLDYYRLACGPKIIIDDVEYTGIHKYSSFLQPAGAPVVAYMREEGGKVYVRYPEITGSSPYNYFNSYEYSDAFIYGEEHLLYDFNMVAGDEIKLDKGVFSCDDAIVLKCIETGSIVNEGVTRKYLKFDADVNVDTSLWMPFIYLVEGIGPVGNCNFAVPYRSDPMPAMISGLQNIRLLYLREKPSDADEGKCLQGKMTYKTPFFDVMGVCDPSVFFWNSADESAPQGNLSVADLDIRIPFSGGKHHIVSLKEDLKDIVVFDAIGREIVRYAPDDRDYALDFNDEYKEIVVVRASTENSVRSLVPHYQSNNRDQHD